MLQYEKYGLFAKPRLFEQPLTGFPAIYIQLDFAFSGNETIFYRNVI